MMPAEAMQLAEMARLTLSGVVVALGLILVAGGSIGMLRFPDFYTRLHAASTSDGVGGVVVLAGLALGASSAALALKLLLMAALLGALAPLSAHLLANAGHAAGLSPLAGPYMAPRPGARRPETRP